MNVEKWDAICVGAGITSLAFGAHLAARGTVARVLVIDKHTAAGGYATHFVRPKIGATFDCSLHKLTGTRPGGNLARMFDALGVSTALETIQHPDHFEACFCGESIALGNSPDAVRAALSARFPDDVDGLNQFFDEVEVHGRNSYYQFQIMSGEYDVDFKQIRFAHRHLKNISVADAVAARVQDGYLREILSAPSIYVGGYPEDLSYLYFLHVVYASLYLGNGYVRGGSQQLSDFLVRKIESAGGRVLLGTTATRIRPNVASGHVVETLRGDFVSDRVYVNASPHHALEQLFEPDPQLESTRARLAALRPSRSTTTLYLTTDVAPETLGLASVETMVFATPQATCIAKRAAAAARPEGDAERLSEQAFWEASPMEVTNYHRLDPSGGPVVCVNVLDEISHWPIRRSGGYKLKKARATDVLMTRLLAAKPGLAGHVVSTELATPRTCQRFTNNTDGAGFGATVGVNAAGHVFHHGFPYEGIQFLSAWVAGGGYETAFGYAEMKALQWVTRPMAESC